MGAIMSKALDSLFSDISKVGLLYSESTGKFSVELQEPKNLNSKLIIKDVPEDLLVIDLDSNFTLNNIFQGGHGECKRSDYLLISESERHIFIIEMKSSSKLKHINKQDVRWQLQGGREFWIYCKNIINSFKDYVENQKDFWKISDFNYIERYILSYGTSINYSEKRPTRLPSSKRKSKYSSNSPCNYETIKGNTIYWNNLKEGYLHRRS